MHADSSYLFFAHTSLDGENMKCEYPFVRSDAQHTDDLAYTMIHENRVVEVCTKCADRIAESDVKW